MIQRRSHGRSRLSWNCGWVQSGPGVFAARVERRPIVALESTLIAHGFPWPLNLEVAREMQEAVQSEGAVPAMIAILDGQIQVGLDDQGLERVAHEKLDKAGVRDLPFHLARKSSAATTVSSTVQIASDLGLPCMATGGIGGVHPGEAGDVSSDLIVLARCPLLVVCSGAKSVLDLPRTLEALETLAVSVAGYQTDEFPAFLSPTSGLPLEHVLNSSREVSAAVRIMRESGSRSAFLLANPVPSQEAIPAAEAAKWVLAAQQEATLQGIGGKQLTPFLLAEIQQRSEGRALQANRALAVANARLAAQIVVELGT